MPREELSLNARWSLTSFDEGEGERIGAHLPGHDTGGWLDAIVPGEVHLDLLRAGKISDPFFGTNSRECRWVEEKEWWYRREFTTPERFAGRRVELHCEGLDTFATVWINGRLAGKHSNMFTKCVLDVSDMLKYGHRNTVAVRFASSTGSVQGKSTDGLAAVFDAHERLHARKAQMSYGWDIAPRLLTTGIWRPIELVASGELSIGSVAVRTACVEQDRADINIEIPLSNHKGHPIQADLHIEIRSGRNGDETIEQTIPVQIQAEEHTANVNLSIPDPRLWWPWNLGRPDLYRLSVKTMVNDKTEDEQRTTFGIRTVELSQDPQPNSRYGFVFAINGRKVFAKGTNWLPGDAVFSRMSRRKYRELIDLALEGNINMLRVWGGGIYEDPYFYRLCDEKGIMVWQDFMFACADYPEDEEFLSEVRNEAKYIVTDLRNHPSIVLWCGDNEVDMVKHSQGKDHRLNRINREVLPEVCTRLDPSRPYIPSSPCSPFTDLNPQSPNEGNSHNWHHGTHYRNDAYTHDESRFVSEIGHLSLPCVDTIRRVIGKEHIWPPENEVWDLHFGTLEHSDPRRREKLDQALAASGFERPDNLEEYAALTQLIQAVAYKEWLERYRRRKFDCGGILYWNLYDNWPQCSDAVVDYYLNPKIAYYYASRALSNMLVSIEELGDGMVGVWLVNDDLHSKSGKLLLRCQRFDGGTAWMRTLPVKLPANSSRMVWDMRLPRPLMEDIRGCFAQVQLQVNGRVTSENFYFPAELRDIEWPQTHLSARIIKASESKGHRRADIGISSGFYGRLVKVETPGRRSIFSSNYFDIPPGEERSVRIVSERHNQGPFTVRISSPNARDTLTLEI